MSSLEDLLVDYLTTEIDVSRLVSSRVYVVEASTGCDKPYVVLRTTKTEADITLSGESNLAKLHLRFDCYGDSAKDAHDVAEAVREAMLVAGAFNSINTDQHAEKDEDSGLFKETLELAFWHDRQ